MQTRIALRYSGPAVESGEMDVYEATANMVAFSDFVLEVARTQYGPNIEAKAQVAGIERGSFVTDIVFNVAGVTSGIFGVTSPSELLRAIHDAFEIWKFLKGRPPKTVSRPNQNNRITVTNNDGQILQVNAQSLTVVFSDKGSDAVERFVRAALKNPGIDDVSLKSGHHQLAKVSQNESDFFTHVAPSETVTDTIVRMALIIEAPVFKENNKWRFFDGQQSFHAEMEDQEFLARVNTGERFGKGDILYADVRINQQQSGMKISADRTIVRVHEHKISPHQISFDDPKT